MTQQRVLVRADGGGALGSGHLTRCLALADELSQRGLTIEFATRSPESMRRTVAAHGHGVVDLSAVRSPGGPIGDAWADHDQLVDARETLALSSDGFDMVVVDHYGLSAPWEMAVGKNRKVLVLDDLANRPHACSVLCDQNWYGPETRHRYTDLVDSSCALLLGPRYAVLQPQYRAIRRRQIARRWPPERILVSFGGTDPAHETEKVVTAVSTPEFADLEVMVVVGSAHRADKTLRELIAQRDRTDFVVSAPSLAPMLGASDLAIGASGAGTWERLCLGVPAIVATTAPHQSGVTKALAEAGMNLWIGLVSDTNERSYQVALRSLQAHGPWLVPPVVDGFGTARLAEAMAPSPHTELRVMEANANDSPSLVGLEGESVGRGPDLLDGPKTWVSETERVQTLLNDPHTLSYVVKMGDVPLGGGIIDALGAVNVGLHRPLMNRGLERYVATRLQTLVGNRAL